jgi:ABC-type multidrug transport system fused ATPase/permease subunit
VVSIAHERIIAGVTQGMQGIKEIRVLGAEGAFLEDVRRSARENSVAETTFNSLLVMPRYLMETVVLFFILGMTLVAITFGGNPTELFSVLAMFAAAGLRALPAMAQVSAALASMNYAVFALHEVDDDLKALDETPPIDRKAISDAGESTELGIFQRVTLEGLSFSYAGATHPAIDSVDLEIRKGTTVGFIGESGSGKTTLIDLLVGLHRPSSGLIKIDGVDLERYGVAHWMRRIAYIPQTPFIGEDTFARNVALGIGQNAIDEARLRRCIEMARLTGVVERLPQGLNTVLIGHGGRLSGGERQRLAVARALYRDRDVLVFDEATSALDAETEREIVQTIESMHGSKTIVIIAHRLSTLRGCDIVHRLSRGKISMSGTLNELTASPSTR